LENTPPTWGRVISFYIIWGKNIIRGRVKRGKRKRQRKKGKEKDETGKEKEKKGTKRVK
jgi:hypothetical protein